MEHVIEKFALDNALRYKGKTKPGAVLGSVIQELPEAKKDIKELKKLAHKICKEVNKMSLEEQELRLMEIAPELLEEEEKEEVQQDIFAGFEVPKHTKVITAFPPEPSKYPHIGHAKSIIINNEFAKRHKGKFILRFEDTNPELAQDEFYKIHLENYEWLGIKPDKIQYASDFMDKFYELAEKLIKSSDAYVCSCAQADVKKARMKGMECVHRQQSTEDNIAAWESMKKDAQGCILRAKIDLKHKNAVMRDPALFRVIEAKHCRQGNQYRAWPTYDFQTSVMDGLEKVTHRFRTKEFEQRSELQKYLQEKLSLPITSTYEFARFNMEGVESSGRIIREKVENNELMGWDDPSLTTLVALKRRGFQPEAIKHFSLITGIP
ncbi:glutamate--tRNA ligase family protein [Nanoarchaeota archaeon]